MRAAVLFISMFIFLGSHAAAQAPSDQDMSAVCSRIADPADRGVCRRYLIERLEAGMGRQMIVSACEIDQAYKSPTVTEEARATLRQAFSGSPLGAIPLSSAAAAICQSLLPLKEVLVR